MSDISKKDLKGWFYGHKWLRWFGVEAITVFTWVFVASSYEDTPMTLVRHELEHIKQARTHGVLIFPLMYAWEHVKGLWKTKSWHLAYRNNPYEVEARKAERPS